MKGGKKFGIAKHIEIKKDFKKLTRRGLNYNQLYLRRLPKEAMIKLQLKHR